MSHTIGIRRWAGLKPHGALDFRANESVDAGMEANRDNHWKAFEDGSQLRVRHLTGDRFELRVSQGHQLRLTRLELAELAEFLDDLASRADQPPA